MPPNQTNVPFQPYPVPEPVPLQHANIKRRKPIGLIISLVLSIMLLLGVSGFALWAFGGRQDYKNNSDKKTNAAVAIAVQNESTKKDNEFVEKEKNPLKTYQAPEAFGSINIQYPKTWSAYVIETDKGSTTVDGFFHPGFVPSTQGNTSFALRLQVTSLAYDLEMKQFDGKVKTGSVKVTPFIPVNVPGVIGSRVEGEITTGKNSIMILVPLRDKTIKISTESPQFASDFNNTILPKLKFVP